MAGLYSKKKREIDVNFLNTIRIMEISNGFNGHKMYEQYRNLLFLCACKLAEL